MTEISENVYVISFVNFHIRWSLTDTQMKVCFTRRVNTLLKIYVDIIANEFFYQLCFLRFGRKTRIDTQNWLWKLKKSGNFLTILQVIDDCLKYMKWTYTFSKSYTANYVKVYYVPILFTSTNCYDSHIIKIHKSNSLRLRNSFEFPNEEVSEIPKNYCFCYNE